ncbi:MAG: P-loop NTPase fold protein, partial [Bacteroidota bacterium]|nr:P-loop NTPase fold protein [Bacteroidota bacterium]
MDLLSKVVLEYPKFSFFVSADYDVFKELSQIIEPKTFKVAELIGQNKTLSPVEEEVVQERVTPPFVEGGEINQQKSEPVEKIVQKQEKSPRRKANRAERFEPTRTKYDDLFREVINSSEFDNLRQEENFVLERGRLHYNEYSSLLKSKYNIAEVYEIEQVLKKNNKLGLGLGIDSLNLDLPDNNTWEVITSVVKDLTKAFDFLSIQRDVLTEFNAMFNELNWASELTRLVSVPLQKTPSELSIQNYFSYFNSPSTSPYIFDETVKKQIVEKVFEREYNPPEFTSFLWAYFESLTQNNPKNPENMGYFVAAVLLHPKIKAIWDIEEQIQIPPPAFNDGRVIGQYSPDEASEIDHLGFKNDVNALAALVAYDKTPLPLAIGLFGNWGSGKSSFMKQLEKRIETLSREQYQNEKELRSADGEMPYCTKITHITFNAWHYSDGNLWASMMVHIFDELLKKIAASKTRDELREELIKKLSATSNAVFEAEKKLGETTLKLNVAKQALLDFNLNRIAIEEKLNTVRFSLRDLFGTLMKDAQFKSIIEQVKSKTGYVKAIETKEQLEEWKNEMESLGMRWKRALTNLFRANKTYAIICILALLIPPLTLLIIKTFDLTTWFNNIYKIIGAAIAFAIPFSERIINQFRKFNSSLDRVEQMQKERMDKISFELKERENILKDEIKIHETAVHEKQKLVQKAKDDEDKAKAELEGIDINRQLSSFIQQRQGGNSYHQHLGIISLIRKDFGLLSQYLKDSRKEKKTEDRIIDRIVLYIDDLDRCKTDRVVAVLEAVHLLLAIDLFVVVVGVD